VQDGPEVWLIGRIRFLLRVTEADQGAQEITARCKTQKLIMEQKDDHPARAGLAKCSTP
jgi:hypothetical protein